MVPRMDGSEPALRRPGGPGDTGGVDKSAARHQKVVETCERGMPNLFVV